MITSKNAFSIAAALVGAAGLIGTNIESYLRGAFNINNLLDLLHGTFDAARESPWPTAATMAFGFAYLCGAIVAIYAKILNKHDNSFKIEYLQNTSAWLAKLMLLCILVASLFATKTNIRRNFESKPKPIESPITLIIWCEGIFIFTFTSIFFTLTSFKQGNKNGSNN